MTWISSRWTQSLWLQPPYLQPTGGEREPRLGRRVTEEPLLLDSRLWIPRHSPGADWEVQVPPWFLEIALWWVLCSPHSQGESLSVVPLVHFSTLLFLLGLAYPPGLQMLTPDGWVGPAITAVSCQRCLSGVCRSKLGKGIGQQQEEKGIQSNSIEVASLIHFCFAFSTVFSHSHGALQGFSFPLGLPNILTNCFGYWGGVCQLFMVFINQAHQHCV